MAIALLTCGTLLHAQVSSYQFQQLSTTYTPITGGTVIGTATANTLAGSLDDAIFPVNFAPFSFTFNGTPYTTLNLSTNGFITFGATAPAASGATTGYAPISAVTGYAGAIACWGGDINGIFNVGGTTSDLRWEVVGSVPNQELVLQWKDFRPAFSTSATLVYRMNMQIRLHQNGRVQVVYGPHGVLAGSPTSASTRQIGLRGATNADFHNRTNAAGVNFNSSTQGGANNATQAYNIVTTPPGMPTNGLTYQWAIPCATPPTGTATAINAGCATYDIQVNVTSAGSSPGGQVNIRVDGNLVQANATVGGSPYTFPGYASGTAHTVVLEHLSDPLCNSLSMPVSSNISCNDLNPLTYDECIGNVCSYTPLTQTNFPGTGGGAIPDNQPTNPLVLTIPVSGVAGVVYDVELNFTGFAHTWVGDLIITLTNPAGASHTVLYRTGTTVCPPGVATAGSSTNLLGNYKFTNSAASTLWSVTIGQASTFNIPSGSYRTTLCPNVATDIPASFGYPAPVGPTNVNGNWTVTVSDHAGSDVGSITGASLDVYWDQPCGAVPAGTATPVNADCATYDIQVDVTTAGDSPGGVVDILIDGNLVQAAAGPGTYGPFGTFADGSNHTVTLVHLGEPSCSVNLPVTSTVPPPTWYADTDGDNYGSGSPAVNALQEGFDNLAAALAGGWVTTNLSDPLGTQPWFQGNSTVFPAFGGPPTSYAAVNWASGAGTSTLSNWLITPVLPLENGAQFTFWSRSIASSFPDRLQVRMSTNGGSTNVGTLATDVGDFTTLLLDINPTLAVGGYPGAWTQYVITITGLGGPVNGRVAFRYFVTNGGPNGANSDYIGVDEVSYVIPASGIIVACAQPPGYVANNDDCDDGDANLTVPGNPCNDGDPQTINDTVDANCVCVGVPNPCTTDLFFSYDATTNSQDLVWTIYDQSDNSVVISGGINPGEGSVPLCLPDGCFYLRVSNSDGNVVDGGYRLLLDVPTGAYGNARIIDNTENLSLGAFADSGISNNDGFCIPLGSGEPIFTSCDRTWWQSGNNIVASEIAAVSAAYAPNNNTAGYEFWFYDPNGGLNVRVLRTHAAANSTGFNPPQIRAAHLSLNSWAVANHLQLNTLYNVRIRGVVGGNPLGEFGPACTLVLDNALAACPPTGLQNIPGHPNFSCGVNKTFGGPNNASNRIQARATLPGANYYEFEFSNPIEGYLFSRFSTNVQRHLNWPASAGLPLNVGSTYQVRVRSSNNNGGNWCAWGWVCDVTIVPSAAPGQENMSMEDVTINMWPNPNNGDQLWLSLDQVAADVETVAVDIYDLSGKRIVAREVATQGGHLYTTLTLNGELAAGMYLVNITAGDAQYTQRLVIQP